MYIEMSSWKLSTLSGGGDESVQLWVRNNAKRLLQPAKAFLRKSVWEISSLWS